MRNGQRARAALAWVWGVIVAQGVGLVAAPGARADVITSWNQYLLDQVIREDNKNPSPPGTPPNPFATGDKPPAVARQLAMIHAAMFDAVNTVERQYKPYAVQPAGYAGANAEVAAIWAAHDVASSLFQGGAPVILSRISSKKNTDLALPQYANLDANTLEVSKNLGRYVAQQILALRANDHSGDVVPYDDDPTGDPTRDAPVKTFGHYRMDQFSNGAQLPAAGPNWPLVTPFALQSGSQFRKAGPPAVTSAAYAQAVQEIRTLGDRRRYDPARYPGGKLPADVARDLRTAFFWAEKGLSADGTKTTTGTVTPPGKWNQIAAAAAAGRNLSVAENARLYALLNIAMADASIAAWDMKYTYDLWRPIHAVRLAAAAGGDPNFNPDLVPAAGDLSWDEWLPMIPTSNHPEYVSGHSTFSGAGAEILTALLGQSGIQFTVTGDDALKIDANGLPDENGTKETRTYTSFWDAAEEAGRSRIFGGIHYTFSNLDGLATGREVGDYVLANVLTPVPEPAGVTVVLVGAAVMGLRRPGRRGAK